MEDKQTIIEIYDLVKSYKGSYDPTLKGLSFTVFKNEIFGILGPNGAGKTTLIKVLCGLFPPDKGNINIDGYDVIKDLNKIKNIIGIVPQDIALYPTLTATENLSFFGKIYGLKGHDLHDRIYHYLTLFGLEKSVKKRIGTFSGGMKRRINLICGILHNPKILFLDEPTVGIDVQSKNLILESLFNINKQGTTIIYTSHLMQEAENLCHRVAIIDEGKLITIGSPSALISYDTRLTNLEDLYLKITGKMIRD